MRRFRFYDEEYSITVTITIPDEGECRVETRHAGHRVCDTKISRKKAWRAIEKYGFREVL